MIGLLNAYHFDGDPNSYQVAYEPMCRAWLHRAFPGVEVKSFKIAAGERPGAPEECSLWLITGSAKSVYEQDEWIQWLGGFTQEIHKNKAKLLGICFGHQMIAHFLGGETTKSDKGWGVGTRPCRVIKDVAWMQPKQEQPVLIYSHQDQVTKLPPGAEHLATSDFCEFEIFSMGEHILSIQGHPEFDAEFAQARMDTRKERIGKEVYLRGSESLKKPNHAMDIWSWVKNWWL